MYIYISIVQVIGTLTSVTLRLLSNQILRVFHEVGDFSFPSENVRNIKHQ